AGHEGCFLGWTCRARAWPRGLPVTHICHRSNSGTLNCLCPLPFDADEENEGDWANRQHADLCFDARVRSKKILLNPPRHGAPIGHNNPGTSFSFSHDSMKSKCSAHQPTGTACRPHSWIRLAYSPASQIPTNGTKRWAASKSALDSCRI